MRLNITRIRADDFGEYQCVSKNEINTTTAMFYVFGIKDFLFSFKLLFGKIYINR